MELWGGIECTVNRVGNRWNDQLALTGHRTRMSDLDAILSLGLTALRYPILWEDVAPEHSDRRDWSWVDPRLDRLRTSGCRVIAGLVHHGSGPHYTDLLDPGFPIGLADHARAVAERFDWIEEWTPVNEPVTTARFSALYGLWYPHAREEAAFWAALLNQIDATRLAMRQVRRINPHARLIQTDDLGRSYATAPLRQQAGFDNMRRWAGWDLLCGQVTPHHPLFDRIAAFGLSDRLRAIADDPCPPDIIAVNHYLTSDRFLDHRTELYPAIEPGGNGQMRYVDVEAIRVLQPAPQGLEGALREAWDRYHIPIAVTEVHNGCTRDEQIRWMARAWSIARRLERDDVDVRAVTSWALFGNDGWNTLLTAPGVYEPGAFDVRGRDVRPTALAGVLRDLSTGREPHPVAAQPGWWERPIRLLHAPVARPASARAHRPVPTPAAAPILIAGATGTLGQALERACRHRGLDCVLTDRTGLSLDDPASIRRALDAHRPWLAINAAGWVRVDDAETAEDACFAANAVGATNFARACDAAGIPSVNFSTDLVFDGTDPDAYDEASAPNPLSAYGRSKAAAERDITALPGRHLIVRTAAFFSPFDPHNFAWAVADTLRRGEPFHAASDHFVSPTYVPHLADAVLDLAIDGERGMWHLTNNTGISWSDFATRIAAACALDTALIVPVPGDELCWTARRPVDATLVSRRGALLPSLDHAIACFAGAMGEIRDRQRAA
ncbi:sugar nucleotide-binding protein [Sphingomonas aliaeris]|uniref:dTDP-4-dehydrorhamnose reductase n=1 Tax=Sphingomonas aliaeris TaxID=2759526 RepID=A0A974NTD6_9SPHN|nr:sugar nucleotide-binding protein [Sphingomonas aliaeris]QQV76640.1 sugar nucleotide-binding protein [Sphingomonas aliaeris]